MPESIVALDDELMDMVRQCYLSTKVTAKTLYPDIFSLPFSPGHDEIFRLLDDDSERKVAIVAPRGFGKTSIVDLAYPTKKILFREKRFIVMVSCSSSVAMMQTESLKNELVCNSMIAKLFGPVKSVEYPFSKEMWVTESGTAVMPRGAGQQVRGLLFNNRRPDLFIVDDIEDSESVESEEQRAKRKRWFFGDLMRAVSEIGGEHPWKIVAIGNMLHEDCLMANLMEDPSWKSVCLDICDDNLHSIWPELVTDATLLEEMDEARRQGVLDTWYRERRCTVITGGDRVFPQSLFRYYDEEDLLHNRNLETVILVDPAKSVTFHSADSAIVAVGIDRIEQKIYVRDIEAGKMHPDSLYDRSIAMALRFGAKVIGVEVTSLNEFITYPFKNAIVSRGIGVEFVELKARGEKQQRVASMAPFYRAGQVLHNPRICAGLEGQLLSFPKSRRWDIMDALSYFVEMFETGGRYFCVKEMGKSWAEVEKEYDELRKQDLLEPALEWEAVC